MVDATIIHAPTSTKNQKRERDPQMHQTRKGNQRFFCMKAHIGMDGVIETIGLSQTFPLVGLAQGILCLDVRHLHAKWAGDNLNGFGITAAVGEACHRN